MFTWLARLFEACGRTSTVTSSPPSSRSSVAEEAEKVPERYDIFSTPNLSSGRLTYKAPETRTPSAIAIPSSLVELNVIDILRRVSVVIYNHVKVGEREVPTTGQAKIFNEKNFRTLSLRYSFVDSPMMAVSGQMFRFEEEIPLTSKAPNVEEVHDFLVNLFAQLLLSSECSVVCLIYVERLMALARVPLLGSNWRPILLCASLLASKMWQDLSHQWNREFAKAYPAYKVAKIDMLEAEFIRAMDWDLGVPSSLFAKYYFALRSLSGREAFRHDYDKIYDRIFQEDTTATSQAPDGADAMMLSCSI